eukprot:148308-Pleurochrysis_carterae.AAC.1
MSQRPSPRPSPWPTTSTPTPTLARTRSPMPSTTPPSPPLAPRTNRRPVLRVDWGWESVYLGYVGGRLEACMRAGLPVRARGWARESPGRGYACARAHAHACARAHAHACARAHAHACIAVSASVLACVRPCRARAPAREPSHAWRLPFFARRLRVRS